MEVEDQTESIPADGANDGADFSSAASALQQNSADSAQRSVEGWVVVATGVHEEAREEDLQDFFGDYGKVRNLHLNLDRQTGYVKGYALIEYASFDDARRAAEKATGKKLLGKLITVDFAFVKDGKEASTQEEGEPGQRRHSSHANRRSSHDETGRDGRWAGRLNGQSSRRTAEHARELSPDRGF
ncbi:hypothetical protein GGI25_003495 [Coemansia spiralis]|uniref:RRM domain-containing protein n=2 Tax=Coemansia TaxID=4863 RepID=A0A9W8G5Z5_9FUNG|nr:hypothetical protein EDC05_003436 [Coemansia umbellata]KAJ2676743.1 hypothetical protein GGI25_003495 [Coemansia spiralis]